MTCGLCRQAQKDGLRHVTPPGDPNGTCHAEVQSDEGGCAGIETVERCPTSEVARLGPELAGFTFLLDRFLPLAGNGMGGWNPDAFRHVFEIYSVPKGQRPVLADFFLIVLSALREVRDVGTAPAGRPENEDSPELKKRRAKVLAMLPRK
jgi:hypothetical protein